MKGKINGRAPFSKIPLLGRYSEMWSRHRYSENCLDFAVSLFFSLDVTVICSFLRGKDESDNVIWLHAILVELRIVWIDHCKPMERMGIPIDCALQAMFCS